MNFSSCMLPWQLLYSVKLLPCTVADSATKTFKEQEKQQEDGGERYF